MTKVGAYKVVGPNSGIKKWAIVGQNSGKDRVPLFSKFHSSCPLSISIESLVSILVLRHKLEFIPKVTSLFEESTF